LPFTLFALTLPPDFTLAHAPDRLDFNAWLANGIPFVTAAETEKLRKRLLEPPAPKPKTKTQQVTLNRDDDKAFIGDAFKKCDV
jgi:hypothetical protein